MPPSSACFIRRQGLLALGLSTLLPMLAGSLGNMALPALGQAFSAPLSLLQWVLVAYLLGIAGLSPLAGRLGDRYGRRRLLLAGIGLFALASLLCTLAPTLNWLIAARALQGVGAACMLSLSLALMGSLATPAHRGRGMGLLGSASACGTALGPALAGLLIDALGWQAPFLLLVLVSLLALACVRFGLPPDESPSREKGSASSGLLPLHLLREPSVRGGLLGSALVASCMVSTLLIGPFYLGGVFGLDVVAVGLWLSAGPLLAALTGMPAGWLVDRLGAGLVVRLGLGAMLLAALGLVTLPATWGPLGYLLPILLMTAGYALFQTANNGAVLRGLVGERGSAAGLLILARNLGQLMGAVGLGGLFTALVGTAGPAALRFAMQSSFAVAALLICVALWLAGFGKWRELATDQGNSVSQKETPPLWRRLGL